MENKMKKRKREDDDDVADDKDKDSKAMRMMRLMGYKKGSALGKKGQGIVEPIKRSKQLGTRGLGFAYENFEADPTIERKPEKINPKQKPVYMSSPPSLVTTTTLIPPQIMESKYDESEVKDTPFISSKNWSKLNRSKSVFDNLDMGEFRSARDRANPFELIKGAGIFLNRAAVKMADIDSNFGFRFSRPEDAGPGGFSEYMGWRRRWHAKGFGMTLSKEKGGFDFNLSKFGPRSPIDTYTMHYGEDGTGDITKTANMRAFEKYVKRNVPHGLGVHTVMTDGGFGISRGRENLQEFLHRQLILCQMTLSMALLRRGGRMCVKVFDTFLPFTNGLIYLVRSCFEKTSVFKPFSSRPANSERYIVAEGRLDEKIVRPVVEYLWSVNDRMNELNAARNRSSNYNTEGADDVLDVNDVVNLQTMSKDKEFVRFMRSHNNRFAQVQIKNLQKIIDFVKNTELVGEPRELIREECLREFGLDGMEERDARLGRAGMHATNDFTSSDPESAFRAIQRRNDSNYRECAMKISQLTGKHISGEKPWLRKIDDWVLMPAISERRCFLVGRGPRLQVVMWPLRDGKEWVPLTFCLPAGTLLLASLVHNPQFTESNRSGVSTAAVVLDVAMLGEMDVQNNSYKQRMLTAAQFADSLYREVDQGKAFQASRFPVLPLIVHRPTSLRSVKDVLERFDNDSMMTTKQEHMGTDLLETFRWRANCLVVMCIPAGSFRNCMRYQLLFDVGGSGGITKSDLSKFVLKWGNTTMNE